MRAYTFGLCILLSCFMCNAVVVAIAIVFVVDVLIVVLSGYFKNFLYLRFYAIIFAASV